jgi:hypothetical protein
MVERHSGRTDRAGTYLGGSDIDDPEKFDGSVRMRRATTAAGCELIYFYRWNSFC